MSVAENIGFRRFDRPPFRWAGALVQRRARCAAHARALIKDYGIRTPGPDAPIAGLSGGNVQRAVLARELSEDVTLLIASNPCFGLDFAAVAEIRTRIMEARNRGTAVLLISADLDEIFALADRIVVMSDGRAVHETPDRPPPTWASSAATWPATPDRCSPVQPNTVPVHPLLQRGPAPGEIARPGDSTRGADVACWLRHTGKGEHP